MFVPYHRVWLPISFDLAFVSDFALALPHLRHEFADQAPKGEAIAQVTFTRLLGIHWVHNKGSHLCLFPTIAFGRPFPSIWLLLVTLLALPPLRATNWLTKRPKATQWPE